MGSIGCHCIALGVSTRVGCENGHSVSTECKVSKPVSARNGKRVFIWDNSGEHRSIVSSVEFLWLLPRDPKRLKEQSKRVPKKSERIQRGPREPQGCPKESRAVQKGAQRGSPNIPEGTPKAFKLNPKGSKSDPKRVPWRLQK